MMLSVSFKGSTSQFELKPNLSAGDVKKHLASSSGMKSSDVKLLCKGKVVTDDVNLFNLLTSGKEIKNPKKTYRLIASGMSSSEAKLHNDNMKKQSTAIGVRDDLTDEGRANITRRQQLGQKMMAQVARKEQLKENLNGKKTYGFGKIETIKDLPDEVAARSILESLANDPGILACMRKHEWNVGSLVEMYPEGKVGESPVCVMGLNENKGQKIHLRLRTDDLKGFRKILSIRDVLFHELSHNVHSDHSDAFWSLMSQVKKECNQLDWTQGNGSSVEGTTHAKPLYNDIDMSSGMARERYEGGTYRLGQSSVEPTEELSISKRDLARRAAISRLESSTKGRNDKECNEKSSHK